MGISINSVKGNDVGCDNGSNSMISGTEVCMSFDSDNVMGSGTEVGMEGNLRKMVVYLGTQLATTATSLASSWFNIMVLISCITGCSYLAPISFVS